MKQGKETKIKEAPVTDPSFDGFDMDSFSFNNRLSLPKKLKENLTAKGLDWRFLNANDFRANGNMHRSHWQPYKPTAEDEVGGINAEGYIQRQDLILGVRPKRVSELYRKHLAERNARQAGHNKQSAQELRRMAKDAGVSKETKVYEGYEENE